MEVQRNELTSQEAVEKLEWAKDALEYACSLLRKIVSGELVPVVHAHWIENWKHQDGRGNRECSKYHGSTNEFTATPICPWCGARMGEQK